MLLLVVFAKVIVLISMFPSSASTYSIQISREGANGRELVKTVQNLSTPM